MGKLFNLLFTLLSIAFFVMLAWITYKAIELRINDKDTAAVEETTNDNTSNVDESSFLSSAKDKMSKATDKAKEIGSNTIDAGKEAVNKMTGKSGIRDEHDPAPKKETVVTPKEK